MEGDDVFESQLRRLSRSTVNSRVSESAEAPTDWKDYFFKRCMRILNPADERLAALKVRNDPVQFYQVMIGKIEGINQQTVFFKNFK
jgi:hypothetical protein